MFNGCLKCNLVSSPLFSHNDVPWMSLSAVRGGPRYPTTSPTPAWLLTDFNHLQAHSQNSLVYTASHKMTGAATFAHRARRRKWQKKLRKEKKSGWGKTKQAVDYFCRFFYFFVSLLGISYVSGLLNGNVWHAPCPFTCLALPAFRRKISYFVAALLRAGNMTCGMPCSSPCPHFPLVTETIC